MKKLTLITAALALLGGASIVGAANQNAKSAKIKSTQTASSQTACCGQAGCSSGQSALFATFFNPAAQILGLVR